MSARIFIDGQAGTTGLEIRERLAGRTDIELVTLPDDARKDRAARRDALNSADVVVLCLPDDAAREAVELIDAPGVRVLDASTAHRVAPGWTYGLPELSPDSRADIRRSTRVANVGCYASAFVLLVRPLVENGILPRDALVSVNAVSGYSGGGRQLIERMQAEQPVPGDPRTYALALQHKHLPEMRRHTGLVNRPLFTPVVGHFYRGMLVHVPLFTAVLAGVDGPGDVVDLWRACYGDEPCLVHQGANPGHCLDDGFLSPLPAAGSDTLELMAFGHAEQIVLTARLDNLGKGAAGNAVQNLNLMIGADETRGLAIETPGNHL